jgi:hypothetical protein
MQNSPELTQPRRVRPDNVLSNLPLEDQDQILSWLEEMTYAAAVEQIAKPRPEGLGLATHVTSLHRFSARHTAEENTVGHDPEIWTDLIERVSASPINFRIVLMQTLERETLLAVERFRENPKDAIKLLDRWLRARAFDLKERKPSAIAHDLAEPGSAVSVETSAEATRAKVSLANCKPPVPETTLHPSVPTAPKVQPSHPPKELSPTKPLLTDIELARGIDRSNFKTDSNLPTNHPNPNILEFDSVFQAALKPLAKQLPKPGLFKKAA